ncbi:hypothetical protein BGW38_001533 [Lunasporangiospora selenospora]|uniref:Uncharacterized protein n=1 Tax=Lunasporangiospora selenospora TaxID=979761 RepID=A0A9P6FTU1_9FUNG|nr:hypothetical protein BGW38_001533 [Lunasporangiospora selenospora]
MRPTENTLRNLLNLFEDKDEINIVDVKKDSGLEEVLNQLAETVSSALSKANASVVVPRLNDDMKKLCGQDRVV